MFEDYTSCERPLPLNASAQTLKVTDMSSSRCLFRLVPSEPPTDETGCLSSEGVFMPTPNASDCHNQNTANDHDLKKGYLRGVAVDMYKKGMLLPTPQMQDYNTGISQEAKKATLERYKDKGVIPSGTYMLRQLAIEGKLPMPQGMLLPTPTAIEGVKYTNTWNPNSQMGQSLSAMAGSGMLPTPIAGPAITVTLESERIANHKNPNLENVMAKELQSMSTYAPSTDGKPSRLSPLFTEEMMGFPLMWVTLPFLSQSGAPKPSKPTATQ